MTELAISIKTLIKETPLLNCIYAIQRKLYNVNYRIYIADDGPISQNKRQLYKKLENEGHKILYLPLNYGASASRNAVLNELHDEQYLLRMDDDFEITNESNIHGMINVLKHNDHIGAIADLERQIGNNKHLQSGRISPWIGDLYIKNNYIIRRMKSLSSFNYLNSAGMRIAKCSFTRNMLLLKREIFADIFWDESIPFIKEHLDFLLQIQYSDWELYFTIDSAHSHRDDLSFFEGDTYNYYNSYRFENSNSSHVNYFLSKWNVNDVRLKRNFNIYYEKIRQLFFSTIS